MENELETWIDGLDEDKKAVITQIVVLTVKEIREQIAQDIEATLPIWKRMGLAKSRRTEKAFKICAAIARGQNEEIPKGDIITS